MLSPYHLDSFIQIFLESIFIQKIKINQKPIVYYLLWCLSNYYKKNPDSNIIIIISTREGPETRTYDFEIDDTSVLIKKTKKLLNNEPFGNYVIDFKNQISEKENIFSNSLNDPFKNFGSFTNQLKIWLNDVELALMTKSCTIECIYLGKYNRELMVDFNFSDFEKKEIPQYYSPKNYYEKEKFISFSNILKHGTAFNFVNLTGPKNNLVVLGNFLENKSLYGINAISWSIDRLANREGFDAWGKLDIFPLDLNKDENFYSPKSQKAHQDNLKHVEEILTRMNSPIIWAAWGNSCINKPYLKKCLRDILEITEKTICTWVHFGELNEQGEPKLPLQININSYRHPFQIQKYLSEE